MTYAHLSWKQFKQLRDRTLSQVFYKEYDDRFVIVMPVKQMKCKIVIPKNVLYDEDDDVYEREPKIIEFKKRYLGHGVVEVLDFTDDFEPEIVDETPEEGVGNDSHLKVG